MTDPHQRSIRDLVDRLTGPAAAAADHPTDAVVVHPGDTLIVRISQIYAAQAADQILTQLRERLPDVDVIVLAADDMAVYRPAAPDCPTHSKQEEAES